ncbi:MAG: hypothetical protein ACPGVN_03555 [Alphaproteobacteria bacterium]
MSAVLVLIGTYDLMTSQWNLFSIVIAVLVLVFALMLVVQLMSLRNSKHPLSVYADKVVIGASLKVTVMREHVLGVGIHPKDETPCLMYKDALKGHEGAIRIPWNMIEDNKEDVVDILKQQLGVA